jgi:hypothetical protein
MHMAIFQCPMRGMILMCFGLSLKCGQFCRWITCGFRIRYPKQCARIHFGLHATQHLQRLSPRVLRLRTTVKIRGLTRKLRKHSLRFIMPVIRTALNVGAMMKAARSLWADCMGLPLAEHFLVKACFRGSQMHQKWLWFG